LPVKYKKKTGRRWWSGGAIHDTGVSPGDAVDAIVPVADENLPLRTIAPNLC
jgi:hypothetical protein